MARSIWNGTISFGMVNVPIKLYSATESKSISFHEVHARDGARIEHRRICSKDEREVPYKQVVKRYEVADDRCVVLEGDEIKAAAGDRGKLIRLEEFVDTADIDPVFYEKTYYAGSREAPDAFRLLFEALRKTGREVADSPRERLQRPAQLAGRMTTAQQAPDSLGGAREPLEGVRD